MKRILVMLTLILIVGCSSNESYKLASQEIIEGVVSKTYSGMKGGYGRPTYNPKVWVQTPESTTPIELPFSHGEKWKVGDSITIIIQKYTTQKQTK